MSTTLSLHMISVYPINATLSAASDSGATTAARCASGRFGIGLQVPFFKTDVTTVTIRLSLPDDAQITLEAHGFVSKFQKIRARISGTGNLVNAGDELMSVECSKEGDLVVARLNFRANSTQNGSFYVFADSDLDEFTLQAFVFEHPSSEHTNARKLGSSVHFETTDVFVFRNYLQLDFELFKEGGELVSLELDTTTPVASAQWWTGRALTPSADTKLTPRPGIGTMLSPLAMERYGPDFGDRGHSVRVLFEQYQDLRFVDVATSDAIVHQLVLRCQFDDGTSKDLPVRLSNDIPYPKPSVSKLISSVRDTMQGRTARFLELGGRGDVSVHIRDQVALGFEYTAIDIDPGPNVDVVGDVHKMSGLFPSEHFDIVYSHSVMEHLVAPWQVVVEASKVLKTGGYFIAYVPTTWALHAEPWDFWRMSGHAWHGLLNAFTGFKILEVEEIGSAVIVPSVQNISGISRMQHDRAPLFTSVVAQKISAPQAEWSGHGALDAAGNYKPQ